jgi:acyl-coenzyme A thioesterase PaaI-like protein
MEFRTPRHGLIEATFACERALEGYPDVLHGGVICALLDGVMTNCLFACGVVAVTGDLRVRFRLPVATSGRAAVRAWVESSSRPLHQLAAELTQDGQIKATATAKFGERTAAVGSEKESAER